MHPMHSMHPNDAMLPLSTAPTAPELGEATGGSMGSPARALHCALTRLIDLTRKC